MGKHTYPIDNVIQHNMPHLLCVAFEHIHQAHCRVTVCARDMVLRHIKSGDCHIWQCYLQLLAHALEGSQIVVIMEYIGIKPSPHVAFCNMLPSAIQAQHCYMLGADAGNRHLLQRWLLSTYWDRPTSVAGLFAGTIVDPEAAAAPKINQMALRHPVCEQCQQPYLSSDKPR